MGCKKGKTLSSTDRGRDVILQARRVGGGGIYRIVFSENDRVYIGSTNNFLMRKRKEIQDNLIQKAFMGLCAGKVKKD